MRNVLLVKYGEIATRGKNRYLVENRLIRTIIERLSPYAGYRVYKEQGRLLVVNEAADFDYDLVIPLVTVLPGVTAVCPCIETEDQSIENLRKLALEHCREHFGTDPVTFKAETKRSDKKYPLTSREVSADIGGYILHNLDNVSVDVHDPDFTVMIELRNNAYIYTKLIEGCGGLPMGTSGKATLLMSGG
ncbi:MAG: tRNA 4-thiouridine(8) synthase ThiI, partial [Firmicutes bacterium]|nr:tRNA 4-thiouridine(8) synthase ThiI [Bacillota bacterium]